MFSLIDVCCSARISICLVFIGFLIAKLCFLSFMIAILKFVFTLLGIYEMRCYRWEYMIGQMPKSIYQKLPYCSTMDSYPWTYLGNIQKSMFEKVACLGVSFSCPWWRPFSVGWVKRSTTPKPGLTLFRAQMRIKLTRYPCWDSIIIPTDFRLEARIYNASGFSVDPNPDLFWE